MSGKPPKCRGCPRCHPMSRGPGGPMWAGASGPHGVPGSHDGGPGPHVGPGPTLRCGMREAQFTLVLKTQASPRGVPSPGFPAPSMVHVFGPFGQNTGQGQVSGGPEASWARIWPVETVDTGQKMPEKHQIWHESGCTATVWPQTLRGKSHGPQDACGPQNGPKIQKSAKKRGKTGFWALGPGPPMDPYGGP